MATTPRTHSSAPRPHATTPRAHSAREDQAARERHERSASRPEPEQVAAPQPRPEDEKSPYARENPPHPQKGPSSSELNSMSSAAKDAHVPNQEGTDQDTTKKD